MIEAYFEFAGDHSWLGFWLGFWALVFTFLFLVGLVDAAMKAYSRTLRRRNIKQRGWPPAHLDADGDWKKPPEVKD